MVAPRLILRTERDGKVVNEAETIVLKEQICSKRTLDTLRSFLEDVSRVGTAKEFFGEKVCPFSSGSKTGTAQVESIINGQQYRRSDGYYYGSMVTYFPADNPRYTIMTAIFTKRQTGKKYYGAGLTGPVQKRIATYIYNRDLNYAREITAKSHCFASDIKDGNIEKIYTVASEYGAPMSSNCEGGWGKSESSKDGKSIKVSQIGIAEHVVPNVVGMGLDDALFLLESCGLAVEVIGQGTVKKQSINPNTMVNKVGQKITITLK
jgi:cell division protein FtsI (penicillin-binding protein 3)